MRIVGFTTSEPDTKVVAVHYSYDRSLRLWIVTAHNAAGDQIGNGAFPALKKHVMDEALAMCRVHGLPRTAIRRIGK